MKLPNLRPVAPSKDIRVTFKPHEAVMLYTILEQACAYWDDRSEKENSKSIDAISDLVWDLEGKLSDKLDFKSVD